LEAIGEIKIAAVITARMGSTRLPRKALINLAGQPLVSHVIDRSNGSRNFLNGVKRYDVVLAIPDGKKDDELEMIGKKLGLNVFRGDEDDVLSRVILAAESVGGDVVFRITGDNPLIDPGVISRTWDGFIDGDWDYAVMEDTPLGTTAEIVTIAALKKAEILSDNPELKEHPTLALYKNPDKFRMRLISPPDRWKHPEWRFTIDTEMDFRFVERIVTDLGKDATLYKIVPYLELHPEIAEMNSQVAQAGWKNLKECKDAIGQR
jgi:spore coat polysaccharide biosynthesis protein SpsF